MDNSDDSKLSNVVRILSLLIILASLLASNQNVRYQVLKLELHVRYWLRRGMFKMYRLSDPTWRSKLLDRQENEGSSRTGRPGWWAHMEDADAAIPIPPSE